MSAHAVPALADAMHTRSPNQDPNKNKIPAVFELRKRKILAELSVPDAEYTDLSPKGSVDEGIRDLIRDINGLPGLVTTSSCAGRVSVFLEGKKKKKRNTSSPNTSTDIGAGTPNKTADDDNEDAERQFASTGGKGGGRWLYVSHDPVTFPITADGANARKSFHELFGLVPGDGNLASTSQKESLRLVHFRFEPMVCCSSYSPIQSLLFQKRRYR